jgi:hypothetical protein
MTVFVYAWLSGLKDADNSPEYSEIFLSCFNPVKEALDMHKSINRHNLVTDVRKLRAFFKDKPEKREIVDKILLACKMPPYPD